MKPSQIFPGAHPNLFEVPQAQKKLDVPPGMHVQQCGGTTFILYDYYFTNKIIGNGSFGIVASGVDKRTNTPIAIKKIKNTFRDLVDSKRVLREIKLLLFFKHPGIIGLLDIIKPQTDDFEDVYLIFELMASDLEKVINSEQKLTEKHIKFFMVQLLSAIHYLHSADVIHRDLKPGNLFVNKQCKLKVGDLNLARKFENINHITEYVVTRWYRAPEILLSQAEYKKAIDIWSIGCIFAELLTRYPLFKGEHYLNQIEYIVVVLGTPDENDFPYKVEEQTMNYIKSLPKREKMPLKDLIPNASEVAIDLLSKMLVYNPDKRYTAEQCLEHEFFKDFKDKINLSKCQAIFDWEFDNIALQKKLIQQEIYKEAENLETQRLGGQKQQWKGEQQKSNQDDQQNGQTNVKTTQELQKQQQQDQVVKQQGQETSQKQMFKQSQFQQQMQEQKKKQLLQQQSLLEHHRKIEQQQQQMLQKEQQQQQQIKEQNGSSDINEKENVKKSEEFPQLEQKQISFSDKLEPSSTSLNSNNKTSDTQKQSDNIQKNQKNGEQYQDQQVQQDVPVMRRNFSFSAEYNAQFIMNDQDQQQKEDSNQNKVEKSTEDKNQKQEEQEKDSNNSKNNEQQQDMSTSAQKE